MNQKGISLSLDKKDVDRTFLSRNQGLMLVLGILVILVVAGMIFLSGTAAKANVTSGIEVGVGADTARWVAMGEYYAAEALEAERSAEASAARWAAMGAHYGVVPFDAERSSAANTARWIAVGEHYRSKSFDLERSAEANIARWNAMGAHYTTDFDAIAAALTARYQAMADWYTR
jgi:hypothetical protein